MSAAFYPLWHFIATFDFYDWLVMVEAKGATEIVFDVSRVKADKFPEDVVRQRFESIIEPGPALAGLPYRFDTTGDTVCSPHMSVLVDWVRGGNSFKRLKSVKPPGASQYTVTLRNDPKVIKRNSNADAWRQFADEIGALVIDDYDDNPIHLHDRLALYAGAKMNFGITTGPMHLISLTEYPMAMFATELTHAGFRRSGIEAGSRFPWMLAHQHLIWAQDDLESIRRHCLPLLG